MCRRTADILCSPKTLKLRSTHDYILLDILLREGHGCFRPLPWGAWVLRDMGATGCPDTLPWGTCVLRATPGTCPCQGEKSSCQKSPTPYWATPANASSCKERSRRKVTGGYGVNYPFNLNTYFMCGYFEASALTFTANLSGQGIQISESHLYFSACTCLVTRIINVLTKCSPTATRHGNECSK